ncbi:MAG: LemA protein [Phycisphaerales bacterium]|jgi:LemA protein
MSPTIIALIVLVSLAVLILFFIVGNYNRLVSVRQHLRDSWAGVDVELKRRYDLIPNLVNTVKGYASHESETLEKVIAARNQAAGNTGSVASQAQDETVLMGALKQLAVVVEQYPDLKANTNFQQLQHQLTDTEDRLAAARRFYNGNAREMNTLVQQFPSNIIAGMFKFVLAEFFEIADAAVREAPKVEF